MMDENVYFAPDGARYRAQKALEYGKCIGCAFVGKGCSRAECRPRHRADHRSVIWIHDDAPTPTAELTAEPAFPGTLRDWFAGMALALGGEYFTGFGNGCHDKEAMSAACYQIADAMMKAREARQ